MSRTPSLNRFLFLLYLFLAIGIFGLSLFSPSVREVAYAPLRDLVLPAADPIVVPVLYSTEKEQWLNEVVEEFETGRAYRVNGRPVQLEMQKMGSREMVLSVLNQETQPVLISPASSLQISILQSQSTNVFGSSLVNANDDNQCPSVVETPLVLVAWKERAQVLWGDAPPERMWLELHDALVNPEGWASYDHPEWGFIKFGHTDPLKSNSGFMTVLLMSYGYFEKTGGLTATEILTDDEYKQWFIELESTISQFGDSTGTYMKDIIAFGPSRYDMVAVYEATAIEQAENAVGRYGELQIYYPPATVMSDHPFCVLEAEWVSADQAEAAHLFIDYLRSEAVQEKALLDHGFRPVNTAVSLDQPGSPFQQFAVNGLQTNLPVEVDVPGGDVLDTLLDFWSRNIQR